MKPKRIPWERVQLPVAVTFAARARLFAEAERLELTPSELLERLILEHVPPVSE